MTYQAAVKDTIWRFWHILELPVWLLTWVKYDSEALRDLEIAFVRIYRYFIKVSASKCFYWKHRCVVLLAWYGLLWYSLTSKFHLWEFTDMFGKVSASKCFYWKHQYVVSLCWHGLLWYSLTLKFHLWKFTDILEKYLLPSASIRSANATFYWVIYTFKAFPDLENAFLRIYRHFIKYLLLTFFMEHLVWFILNGLIYDFCFIWYFDWFWCTLMNLLCASNRSTKAPQLLILGVAGIRFRSAARFNDFTYASLGKTDRQGHPSRPSGLKP